MLTKFAKYLGVRIRETLLGICMTFCGNAYTSSPLLRIPLQLEHETASLNLGWLLGVLEHRSCKVYEHHVAP